jgi:hypothetical protein
MTLTLQNPVTLPRTNIPWSSQGASLATSVTTAVHRQIEGIRRATVDLSTAGIPTARSLPPDRLRPFVASRQLPGTNQNT